MCGGIEPKRLFCTPRDRRLMPETFSKLGLKRDSSACPFG